MTGAGPDPVDLGLVGDVVGFNLPLLGDLWARGYVPVLACLGCDRRGAAAQHQRRHRGEPAGRRAAGRRAGARHLRARACCAT